MTHDGFRKKLNDHIISKVEYYEPRARYPRLLGYNAVKGYHGFGGTIEIAKITTNLNAFGWASLCRSIESAKNVEKMILGAKLTDVFDSEVGILDDKLIPFDIALHDLAGRILELPVNRMINPRAGNRVREYDAAIYMNDLIPEDNPFGFDKVLQECDDDYAAGYRNMKIKIGRGKKWMKHDEGLDRDIKIVRAIAERYPDVGLMVDANDGYTLDDCFAFLEGIGDVRLFWFEEPFRENIDEFAKLRKYMNRHCPATYIADGESGPDIPLLFDLAEQGLLDIWLPDICSFGFTAWRKLIPKLAEKGYMCSPHAWGQRLKTYYAAHIATAYPHNAPFVEGVLGTTEGVDESGYKFARGVLYVPDSPGFGLNLQWAPELTNE